MGATVLPVFLTAFPTGIISGNPHTSLEVLEITRIISDLEHTQQYEDILTGIPVSTDFQEWRSLDDLFTNKSLLPRLQALRIDIGCICTKVVGDPVMTKEYEGLREMHGPRCGSMVHALLPKSVKRVPIVDFGLTSDETSEFDAASKIYHSGNPFSLTW
ncbi:hypothetical protein DFP72DRAFT_910457 [Ephemerocybe angulata]|uniref:Uncharacterized protein n=1 Tax=Ephemerocybe angulata TaxID=980116 RepID=A0A8H6HPW6_9AGAR|nr:hypothetical protein DFP72DRAFT_910457 [Tulosesus angulatus]